ncbi:MAG TPA: hypothetical protein VFA43_11815 [Gemmatimonadaceae bacterium]|nr:hypothetical protein [Gemmatimonadaceae bacterium]
MVIALLCALQHVLAPGDHSLRVDRIRAGTDTIVVLAKKPHADEQLVTTLVRRVERDDDVWRVVQRYESPDGEWEYDTLIVSAQTLALRRSVELGATSARRLRYDGSHLIGTFESELANATSIDQTPGPFFSEATTETFLAAYPVDQGAVAFNEMSATDLKVRPAQLTVDSTASIVTADGWIDCYVAHGLGHETLWIARGDGRLVRERWMERDGTVMWKLPRRDAPFRREAYLSTR